MKKIVSVLSFFIVALFVFNFATPTKASAAWESSSWQPAPTFGTKCKVKVWTDSYNYYANATSIDTYAETNGYCKNIYYMMNVGISNYELPQYFTGYYNRKTNVKSFGLTNVKLSQNTPANVFVWLYPTSARTKSVQYVKKSIYLYAKTISTTQAEQLAWDYLKKKNYPIAKNDRIRYDHTTGNTYYLQHYQVMEDHLATINWYEVNKTTGKITPMFNF